MRTFLLLFFATMSLALVACIGSRSDLNDALDPLDAAAAFDATPDRDAGRDARVDTGPDVQYVPKAKRCARDGGPPDPFVFEGGVSLLDASDEAGDIGLPQSATAGGPVLREPVFVPITFKEDQDGTSDELEDFISSVGCTEYWDRIARDYGVGVGVSDKPVRLPDAAWTKIDDTQLANWLRTKLDQKDPAFPPPTPNSIYVIFLPDTTTVTLQGSTSCVSFGAYHFNTRLSNGTKVAYATIPRCSGFGGGGLDDVTAPTTHELIEAVTDPYPSLAPAHTRTDDVHLAWSIFAGGEVADLCEFNSNEFLTPASYPWAVARSWSNAEAALGHDPCVPAEGNPWATALPAQPDVIHYFNANNPMRGIKLAANAQITVPLRVVGTGTGQVTIDAVDGSKMRGGPTRLNLSIAPSTASIGDTVALTISKLSDGQGGVEVFMLRTQVGGREIVSWGATGAQ